MDIIFGRWIESWRAVKSELHAWFLALETTESTRVVTNRAREHHIVNMKKLEVTEQDDVVGLV